MGIDKIGNINNINGYNKINKTNSTDKLKDGDSVSISKEALNKAEQAKIMEIVNNAPDVRIDRINEVKEKLKDPNYINDTLINSVADKIMDSFKI